MTRPSALAAFALAACGADPSDPASGSSSTSFSNSASTTGAGGDETAAGSDAESTSGSTDSSTGVDEAGSSSSSSDPWTTSTGEPATSSTSSSSGALEPACSDGAVDDGEACDDGNAQDGDGCSAACSLERWEHEGVALAVPVDELVGWEPCWSGTYEAGDLVEEITDACQGDHLMMACRPKGSGTLTVAAHAPREDVLFPVDYGAGERHEANGVAWYWSPTSNIEGFAPGGSADGCHTEGSQPGYLCWVNADDDPLTFQTGRRCGEIAVTSNNIANDWERLIFGSSGESVGRIAV